MVSRHTVVNELQLRLRMTDAVEPRSAITKRAERGCYASRCFVQLSASKRTKVDVHKFEIKAFPMLVRGKGSTVETTASSSMTSKN
jgi:hypothetical protein